MTLQVQLSYMQMGGWIVLAAVILLVHVMVVINMMVVECTSTFIDSIPLFRLLILIVIGFGFNVMSAQRVDAILD